MRFVNRADAGRQLAAILRSHGPSDPIVVGIVRGGVPVAVEIARALRAPLDICVVRNVLARLQPPRVIGAVAEGGAAYLDAGHIASLDVTDDDVDREVAFELDEVARLSALLRDEPPLDLRGRHVILVDDGVVTGETIRAAIRSLRRTARSVDLAVPVGATQILERIRPFVDRLHCLTSDRSLAAVGARYESFEPLSDAEVVGALAARREGQMQRLREIGSFGLASQVLHRGA